MKASQLVQYGRDLCVAKVVYGTGFQLDTITKAKVTAKKKQYPDKLKKVVAGGITMEENLLKNIGKMSADCCGWIKGISMGRTPTDNTATYKKSLDLTIKDMAKSCTGIVKDYTKAVPGMFMWFDDYSHCAIYIGNGQCIESSPSLGGMAITKITYQYGGKKWAGYGKLPWVEYESKVVTLQRYTGPLPNLSKAKNKKYFVKGESSDDTMYIKKFLTWYGLPVSTGMTLQDKDIASIKQFQSKNSLTADGLFGQKTLERAKVTTKII